MKSTALFFCLLFSLTGYANEVFKVETEIVVWKCASPRQDCDQNVYQDSLTQTLEIAPDEDWFSGSADFNFKFLGRNLFATLQISRSPDGQTYWLFPGAFIDYDSTEYPTVTVYYGDLQVHRPSEVKWWSLPRAYTDDGLYQIILNIKSIR